MNQRRLDDIANRQSTAFTIDNDEELTLEDEMTVITPVVLNEVAANPEVTSSDHSSNDPTLSLRPMLRTHLSNNMERLLVSSNGN